MRLANKKIAVLLEEGFEDLEFWVTVMRLREEGAKVVVVGVEANKTVKGKNALSATSLVAARDVRRRSSTRWSCRAAGRRTSCAATTK